MCRIEVALAEFPSGTDGFTHDTASHKIRQCTAHPRRLRSAVAGPPTLPKLLRAAQRPLHLRHVVLQLRGGRLQHGAAMRAALKGARIAYSLTAFPFFMVSLPIYKDIFATAKKTGYSRDGVCLPAKAAADYAWVAAGDDDEGAQEEAR